MKLYRFSPIKTESELMDAITHLHIESYKLCNMSFGEVLPNVGNVGVFCHYQDKYEYLTSVRNTLTEPAEIEGQKYFKLLSPIVIKESDSAPEATYTHLYIRKPDPYRHHVGDLDFYLPESDYRALKQSMLKGNRVAGARVFPTDRLDMIELHDPDSDVLAYVSYKDMTEIVRVTKSGI